VRKVAKPLTAARSEIGWRDPQNCLVSGYNLFPATSPSAVPQAMRVTERSFSPLGGSSDVAQSMG
jgi:hypothetical protein